MIFLKFPLSIFILLSCFFVQADEGTGPDQVDEVQEEVNRRLREAIITGSIEDAQRFLDAGAILGKGAIFYSDDLEEIEFVLENGADPNVIGWKTHSTRLHNETDPEIVALLLKYGANPNAKDGARFTPLHTNQSPEVARLLLEHDADPDAISETNMRVTPLHDNYRFIHPAKAQVLLEAGADPNIGDIDGNTPLHGQMDIEMVELLLKNGADPNARNDKGQTPLHHKNLTPEVAHLLLEYGADPDLVDEDGKMTFVKRFPNLFQEVEPSPEKQLEALARRERSRQHTSCRYIDKPSPVPFTCDHRTICTGRVSCTLDIGMAPNTAQIEREFSVICYSVHHDGGICPEARDCALDPSMMEINRMEQMQNREQNRRNRRQQRGRGLR